MAGYRDRTIALDFGWLAEGCRVVILNPRLMAFDPKEWAELDESDRINRRLASLVIEWHVPDPADDSTMLPSPAADPDVLYRTPVEIVRVIGKLWRDSLDPLVEKATTSTSSSTSKTSSKASGAA